MIITWAKYPLLFSSLEASIKKSSIKNKAVVLTTALLNRFFSFYYRTVLILRSCIQFCLKASQLSDEQSRKR